MDGLLHTATRSRHLGALFDEDFDVLQAAPEPEVIEPVFSSSELAATREAAWHDGHTAGMQEAAEGEAAATLLALDSIASQIKADRNAANTLAEQAAEAITRLLLDSLAAAFPALCTQYGEAEVRAVVRTVLPALTQEPAITVRAHPHTIAALARELEHLDPDLAAHVQTTPCDAMRPGDVRIAWHNGAAVRDAAALWRQVASVLVPAGLLREEAMTMETIDGD